MFLEHEAEGEAPATLVALVRTLASVGNHVPLHVSPACVALVAVGTLELALHQVVLPVLGARQQGVEALATLLTDVSQAGPVGLPVLQQLGGCGEALATDGAELGELALAWVGLPVVDGQRTEVGKTALALLAREGDGCPKVLPLVLGQVPGVLEGPVAMGAVEGPLTCVGELVSLHI